MKTSDWVFNKFTTESTHTLQLHDIIATVMVFKTDRWAVSVDCGCGDHRNIPPCTVTLAQGYPNEAAAQDAGDRVAKLWIAGVEAMK